MAKSKSLGYRRPKSETGKCKAAELKKNEKRHEASLWGRTTLDIGGPQDPPRPLKTPYSPSTELGHALQVPPADRRFACIFILPPKQNICAVVSR